MVDIVDEARRLLEKDCAMAMAFAQSEERNRCVRIAARWAVFVQKNGGSVETLGVLTKIALEVIGGDDPGMPWNQPQHGGDVAIVLDIKAAKRDH
jgi:hypothetical protein